MCANATRTSNMFPPRSVVAIPGGCRGLDVSRLNQASLFLLAVCFACLWLDLFIRRIGFHRSTQEIAMFWTSNDVYHAQYFIDNRDVIRMRSRRILLQNYRRVSIGAYGTKQILPGVCLWERVVRFTTSKSNNYCSVCPPVARSAMYSPLEVFARFNERREHQQQQPR